MAFRTPIKPLWHLGRTTDVRVACHGAAPGYDLWTPNLQRLYYLPESPGAVRALLILLIQVVILVVLAALFAEVRDLRRQVNGQSPRPDIDPTSGIRAQVSDRDAWGGLARARPRRRVADPTAAIRAQDRK